MGRYDAIETSKPVSRAFIVFIVVGLAIAAAVFYIFEQHQGKAQQEIEYATSRLSVPEKPKTLVEDEKEKLPVRSSTVSEQEKLRVDKSQQMIVEKNFQLPPLADSDEVFRKNLLEISPGFSVWLQGENLIRRYMVIINDFSQGLRIYKHMHFMSLNQPFAVKQDQQGLYMDPAGYNRYNELVAAIDAVSIQQALQLYKRYRPLLQQVFEQFGYPVNYHLDDIIKKAVANIVAAPVIEGRIGLVHHSVRYKYADKSIETLNPIQKQMIRMGPENTHIVQSKLRAIIVALIADKNL